MKAATDISGLKALLQAALKAQRARSSQAKPKR
jgi:hypothetical protein